MRQPLFSFSYRKVGGLHFIKLGRFGCSFYVSRTHSAPRHETLPEWSGSPDPVDPDNYWIDDKTGERIRAV